MKKLSWVATAIAALMLGASAAMKLMFVFKGGKEMAEGMARFGIPENLILTLAILEIGSLVLHLIPRTSVLGAILLTGYLGGAVCTHLRISDSVIGPLIPGVLVWAGLYLRDARIRELIPLNK
jgi:hypothetical protein